MIEGSCVTVLEVMACLLGEASTLGFGRLLEGYNRLEYQALALDLALAQVAAAFMHSTGRVANTALGTVVPTQGGVRRKNVFIVGSTSFPNAQKVPALVATLLRKLRERMPATAILREQLASQLPSIRWPVGEPPPFASLRLG